MQDDTDDAAGPTADAGQSRAAARYARPSRAERTARMPDLLAMPAMPLSDVALFLDMPFVTIEEFRRKGLGPRCFRIGRRIFVRQVDLREWLDALAKSEPA